MAESTSHSMALKAPDTYHLTLSRKKKKSTLVLDLSVDSGTYCRILRPTLECSSRTHYASVESSMVFQNSPYE